MNITYLRSFYYAVKFNSISKAAEYMHFTQPGLSMQLQSLEKEVGVKLLNRSNSGVELTEEGKIVYDYVCTMLTLTENLERDLKSIQNRKSSLTICSCKSIGECVLLCSVYMFKKQHPDTDITIKIHNSKSVLKKILNHDANIGIVTGIKIPKNIVSVPIMHDNLILVCDKPFNKPISIDEFTALPLILREDGSGVLSLLEEALKERDLTLKDLNVLISFNSVESIKASALASRGYAFLPESVARHYLKSNRLYKIEIKDFAISFDYSVIYRDNYSPAEQEKNFLHFLTTDKRCFQKSLEEIGERERQRCQDTVPYTAFL